MHTSLASTSSRRGLHLRWISVLSLIALVCAPLALAKPFLDRRALAELANGDLLSLAASPDPSKNLLVDDRNSHLSKILIPRAPETENNTFVKDYIVSTLKALDWHIEQDTFTDSTPYGVKTFTNVIATKDPAAPRRLVLAAHFDSKFFPTYPQNQFVGATDSAAPCAFMLDLAETLNPLLNQRHKEYEDGLVDDDDLAETTLQLVFFDGEEAFKDWTATDSIYGARHLADRWSTAYIHPNAKRRLLPPSATELSTIEHLVLLDLLGAPNPIVRSFWHETGWLFDAMVSAETRLADSGAFTSVPGESDLRSFFIPRTGSGYAGYIEDDHIPFLKAGVSVLHVIASPFPRVWHTLQDDASALDLPTMTRWNQILRIFLAEYLGLRPLSTARSEPPSHHARSDDELISYDVEI